MKRHLIVLVLAFTTVAGCAPAMYSGSGTRTYMGFSIGISNAPPPPRVYVAEARLVAVSPRVYVVEDSPYDMFRCGSYFYLSSGGFWYRSYSTSGPFVAVDVRSVPREVLSVPARHWEHHPLGGPPGQMKRRGPDRG